MSGLPTFLTSEASWFMDWISSLMSSARVSASFRTLPANFLFRLRILIDPVIRQVRLAAGNFVDTLEFLGGGTTAEVWLVANRTLTHLHARSIAQY
jgi:hypothetical protein